MGRIRENISKNINYYRKQSNLSQKDLALQLNVKNSSVSNWENGLNSPDIETLFSMCKIFNISINELYGAISGIEDNPSHDIMLQKYMKLSSSHKSLIDEIVDSLLLKESQ